MADSDAVRRAAIEDNDQEEGAVENNGRANRLPPARPILLLRHALPGATLPAQTLSAP
jgi:hypothetical protein